MQKRKHNKSKSSIRRGEAVDPFEDSASPTSTQSDRRERKRVRWVGQSASAGTDSEDEIESSEKVRTLQS